MRRGSLYYTFNQRKEACTLLLRTTFELLDRTEHAQTTKSWSNYWRYDANSVVKPSEPARPYELHDAEAAPAAQS
jgi:hypothetical protein